MSHRFNILLFIYNEKPLAISDKGLFYPALIPGVFPCEAIAAVNRLITARLERYLGGAAASVTNCIIKLTGGIAPVVVPAIAVTPVCTAGRAAARLVGEAFFSKESLL